MRDISSRCKQRISMTINWFIHDLVILVTNVKQMELMDSRYIIWIKELSIYDASILTECVIINRLNINKVHWNHYLKFEMKWYLHFQFTDSNGMYMQ